MTEYVYNAPLVTPTISTAGMLISDLTFVISNAAGFPSPNFRIKINDEIMLVTTVVGTTFTVTRAQEGTSAAAHVLGASVWGVVTAGALTAAFGTGSTSQTYIDLLANRSNTITSSATPIPVADTTDTFTVTALATGATFGVPTYTTTPIDGQALLIRIKDNGSVQTLAWNAIYAAVGVTLPTTTVTSKYLYVGCIYNVQSTKWDVLAVCEQV
jgi:hypothetical protein